MTSSQFILGLLTLSVSRVLMDVIPISVNYCTERVSILNDYEILRQLICITITLFTLVQWFYVSWGYILKLQ